jgi:hypothetical protein
MSPTRFRRLPVLLPLLTAALVIGCSGDPLSSEIAAPSLARSGEGGSTTRFTLPVDETMHAGTCGLTTDVRLLGEITFVVHVTETGTGRRIGHINSSARGTGTGEDGSRYRFSYNNNARVVDFVGEFSPDNPPYTAYVVDRFQLSGLGGAPNVNTHWLFGIRLDAAGNATVLRDVPRNQECDPI